MAALSPAEATRPIDPCSPAAVSTARKDLARNCDPRSLCTTTTPAGRRRATAVRSAVTASWAVIRSSIAYPTMRLLNRSLIAQQYSLPSAVGCSV
jgi:hypothetical protein